MHVIACGKSGRWPIDSIGSKVAAIRQRELRLQDEIVRHGGAGPVHSLPTPTTLMPSDGLQPQQRDYTTPNHIRYTTQPEPDRKKIAINPSRGHDRGPADESLSVALAKTKVSLRLWPKGKCHQGFGQKESVIKAAHLGMQTWHTTPCLLHSCNTQPWPIEWQPRDMGNPADRMTAMGHG